MSLNVTVVDDDPDFIRQVNRRWEKSRDSKHRFKFVENPYDFFEQGNALSDSVHLFLVDWDLGAYGFAVDFISQAHRKGYVVPFVVITTRNKRTQITGDELVSTLDAGASNLLEKSIFDNWYTLEEHIEKEYRKFVLIYQHCNRSVFERGVEHLGRPIENIRTSSIMLRAIQDLNSNNRRRASVKAIGEIACELSRYLIEIGDGIPRCLIGDSSSRDPSLPASGLNERVTELAQKICDLLDKKTTTRIDSLLRRCKDEIETSDFEKEFSAEVKRLIESHGPDLVATAFLSRVASLTQGDQYLVIAILRALRNSYSLCSYYRQSSDLNSMRLQTIREMGREADYLADSELGQFSKFKVGRVLEFGHTLN